MIPTTVPELEGKTIKRVEVHSDVVLIALEDEDRAVTVFRVDGDLRVEVRSRGPEGARGPAGRGYPGQFRYQGELPDYVDR
jgi:hypothetical protein